MQGILQAIILGFIQGVTEFLPVSSSGHLVIAQQIMGIHDESLLFETAVHVATLGAILVFLRKRILSIKISDIWRVSIATIPAVIVGLLFRTYISSAFESLVTVGFALLITGVLNFGTYKILKNKKHEVSSGENNQLAEKGERASALKNTASLVQALFIGSFQAIAITPGVSRSGATLFASVSQGLSKKEAFEFSFLMAIPAILGALVLQLAEMNQVQLMTSKWQTLFAGMIAAFISGLLSLALLKKIINQSRFDLFSWYVFLLGSAVVISELF